MRRYFPSKSATNFTNHLFKRLLDGQLPRRRRRNSWISLNRFVQLFQPALFLRFSMVIRVLRSISLSHIYNLNDLKVASCFAPLYLHITKICHFSFSSRKQEEMSYQSREKRKNPGGAFPLVWPHSSLRRASSDFGARTRNGPTSIASKWL